MRKGLIVLVAAASFACGAWLSPSFTARAQESTTSPIYIRSGQTIEAIVSTGWNCTAEKVSGNWVRCKGGTWRNIETGVGLRIRPVD